MVEYRFQERFENHKVSVMSKSKALTLRLAGIISLLRNAIKGEDEELDTVVTKEDYTMATYIVKYSVATSFKLFTKFDGTKDKKTKKNEKTLVKMPVPPPEFFTIDYAQKNKSIVNRIISKPLKSIAEITKFKTYPQIEGATGADVANKFLKGLETVGLGNITPNGKNFKRIHPDEVEGDEEKENVKKRLKLFDVDVDIKEC